MNYILVLILLTSQIYSQNIKKDITIIYDENNPLSMLLERDMENYKKNSKTTLLLTKTNKKNIDTQILWFKGKIDNISNINYDYLIVESPNQLIELDEKNSKKPILLILNKKDMNIGYNIINKYSNVQLFIGDILALEIENKIVPLIDAFINKKIISKKYKFTQKNKLLKIKALKQNRVLEIFNKNWYISKKCNNSCKLSFLTYPKYIYSIFYKVDIKNKKISKAIRNIFKLIKSKEYLKALLLTIEIRSKYKTEFKFQSFIKKLHDKIVIEEKQLDINIKN